MVEGTLGMKGYWQDPGQSSPLVHVLLLDQPLTGHHLPDYVHRLHRAAVHVVHVVVKGVAVGKCSSVNQTQM